jgi:hypothetical protein
MLCNVEIWTVLMLNWLMTTHIISFCTWKDFPAYFLYQADVHNGVRKLTGYNLKLVLAKLSTLS